MSEKNRITEMVINQMMKGPHYGRLRVTKKQREPFCRKHEDKVHWVLEHLPFHKRCSAAVPAIICKALIVYGLEKTQKFCDALTNMKFEGPDDPVHMLWLFLLRNKARDEKTVEVYRKTLSVVRTYMEGKKITKIYAAKSDIFEWDEDFTLPDNLLAKNDEVDLAILKQRLAEKKDEYDPRKFFAGGLS